MAAKCYNSIVYSCFFAENAQAKHYHCDIILHAQILVCGLLGEAHKGEGECPLSPKGGVKGRVPVPENCSGHYCQYIKYVKNRVSIDQWGHTGFGFKGTMVQILVGEKKSPLWFLSCNLIIDVSHSIKKNIPNGLFFLLMDRHRPIPAELIFGTIFTTYLLHSHFQFDFYIILNRFIKKH